MYENSNWTGTFYARKSWNYPPHVEFHIASRLHENEQTNKAFVTNHKMKNNQRPTHATDTVILYCRLVKRGPTNLFHTTKTLEIEGLENLNLLCKCWPFSDNSLCTVLKAFDLRQTHGWRGVSSVYRVNSLYQGNTKNRPQTALTSVLQLTSAPFWSRYLTISKWRASGATRSGVSPVCFKKVSRNLPGEISVTSSLTQNLYSCSEHPLLAEVDI